MQGPGFNPQHCQKANKNKIYKELKLLSSKKQNKKNPKITNYQIKLWVMNLDRYISKEETKMANRYMK
jgi:hypothetical protein